RVGVAVVGHGIAGIRLGVELLAEAIGLTVTLSRCFQKLIERPDAGAAHSLIRTHRRARQTKMQMQRPKRQRQRDSRAVRIRHQAYFFGHEVMVHTSRHQRHLWIGPIRVALVDHTISEFDQARHITLGMLIIERYETEISARRIRRLQTRSRPNRIGPTALLEFLVATRKQREFGARPGAAGQVDGLASDETGGTKDANFHDSSLYEKNSSWRGVRLAAPQVIYYP